LQKITSLLDPNEPSKVVTYSMDTPNVVSPFSKVIDHIITICGFPSGSTMVEVIQSKAWTDIVDMAMITLKDVDEFKTSNNDGSYKATL
jgi:hypothetical protein